MKSGSALYSVAVANSVVVARVLLVVLAELSFAAAAHRWCWISRWRIVILLADNVEGATVPLMADGLQGGFGGTVNPHRRRCFWGGSASRWCRWRRRKNLPHVLAWGKGRLIDAHARGGTGGLGGTGGAGGCLVDCQEVALKCHRCAG